MTDWTAGLPYARVLAWPGPADPLDLSQRLEGRYTEALAWSGNDLLFTAYPPGEPETWESAADTGLYVWNALTGAIQPLIAGAFWAEISPDGSRLAAHLAGAPQVEPTAAAPATATLAAGEAGVLTVTGRVPYVALFSWPERTLLAAEPASDREVANILDFIYTLQPSFSPDDAYLAYQPAGGGVALLDDEGRVRPLVTGQLVDDMAWGGDRDLVIYAQQQLWVLRLD